MGRRENVLEDAVGVLTAEGIEAAYVRGDVRSEESCENAVEDAVKQFGKLDILVNCAAGNFLSPGTLWGKELFHVSPKLSDAVAPPLTAEALTSKGFRTVMEIDCIGSFNMALAAFPYLQETGGKHSSTPHHTWCPGTSLTDHLWWFTAAAGDAVIINITAGFEHPPFFQVHASAAKMGVNSLTRSFALEVSLLQTFPGTFWRTFSTFRPHFVSFFRSALRSAFDKIPSLCIK